MVGMGCVLVDGKVLPRRAIDSGHEPPVGPVFRLQGRALTHATRERYLPAPDTYMDTLDTLRPLRFLFFIY